MTVHEISLISNNHIVQHPPTVMGFQDASVLTDGSHLTFSYPTKHTFSVKWHFDGQLVPIDVIRIVTNCGDYRPSLYCNYSQLIFNMSNGLEAIADINSLDNIMTVQLFRYENDCYNHILLLDTESSINPSCAWDCEECLRFLHINLTHNTMDTSSDINQVPSSSNCQCPSFTLTHSDDNQFEVWQHDNFMGVLVPDGNSDRLQMSWKQWMGQETLCRQSYLPNTDDFMSVPSYKGLELEFDFNHTNGPLYHGYNSNRTQVDAFRLDIEKLLDDLFDSTWVYTVDIGPNTSYPEVDTYSYVIYIKSIPSNNSHSVVGLELKYNTSYDTIVEEFINLISRSFQTNSSFICNLRGTHDILLSDVGDCSSYFLTTAAPPEGKKHLDVVAIVISVSVASAGCLIAAILLLVCYKRHLACFKNTEKGRDLDWERVDIYPNQKEVQTEAKRKMVVPRSTAHIGQSVSTLVRNVSIRINTVNDYQKVPQSETACLALTNINDENQDEVLLTKVVRQSEPMHNQPMSNAPSQQTNTNEIYHAQSVHSSHNHPMPQRIKKDASECIVDPTKWSVYEVAAWLSSLEGGKYARYKYAFIKNEFDGEELECLNENVLKEQRYGVKKVSHRRGIVKAVKQLLMGGNDTYIDEDDDKDDLKAQNDVDNALVMFFGISTYDHSSYPYLDDIGEDEQCFRDTFEGKYRYTFIANEYDRKWSRSEAEEWIQAKRDTILLDQGTRYNALIFCGASHGSMHSMICSDGSEFNLKDIRSSFSSSVNTKFRKLPKVFIFNCCRTPYEKPRTSQENSSSAGYSVTITGSEGNSVFGSRLSGYIATAFSTCYDKKMTKLHDIIMEATNKADSEGRMTLRLQEHDIRIDNVWFVKHTQSRGVEVGAQLDGTAPIRDDELRTILEPHD
eukprot:316360_1